VSTAVPRRFDCRLGLGELRTNVAVIDDRDHLPVVTVVPSSTGERPSSASVSSRPADFGDHIDDARLPPARR
jgi:hypothetical protein